MQGNTETNTTDTKTETPPIPFTRADHRDALHLHAAEIDANLCELHAALLEIESELPKRHCVSDAVKIVHDRVAGIHTETAHMRRSNFMAPTETEKPQSTGIPSRHMIEAHVDNVRAFLEDASHDVAALLVTQHPDADRGFATGVDLADRMVATNLKIACALFELREFETALYFATHPTLAPAETGDAS